MYYISELRVSGEAPRNTTHEKSVQELVCSVLIFKRYPVVVTELNHRTTDLFVVLRLVLS